MGHLDHRLVVLLVTTDEQTRCSETVDELLRCKCMRKVRQRCALARWDATFWIDFHQLFEHLAQRALRFLFECVIRGVGALSNGTLDAANQNLRRAA